MLRIEGSGNLKDQTRVCMRVAEAPTPQGGRCEPHQGLQSVLAPCCSSALLQVDTGYDLQAWHVALAGSDGVLEDQH